MRSPIRRAWAVNCWGAGGCRFLLGAGGDEGDQAIGGERNFGSRRKTIKRLAPGTHAAAIADRCRIRKIVIDVAVEYLKPVSGKRQSDGVAVLRLLGQVGYHDHVRRLGFDPSVQNDNPVEIFSAR